MGKKIAFLPILLLIAILLTSCSNLSNTEVKKDAAHAAFIVQKINDLADGLTGLKSQMSDFSQEKLSDDKWVSQTKDYLNQMEGAMDDIIQYENIPKKTASLHQTLVALCEKGKTSIEEFKNGIESQNVMRIIKANNGLSDFSGQCDNYIKQIKEMISGE